jgi:hypothetical protein
MGISGSESCQACSQSSGACSLAACNTTDDCCPSNYCLNNVCHPCTSI